MQNQIYTSSTQIADWAKTKEAQSALPRLIRRLIHATVKSSSCDFPAGDSTSLPSWDGELHCEEETAWTSKGCSYWELSCRHDVATKAKEDYDKRTEQTEAGIRQQTTLVIITARKWSGKKKWLTAKDKAHEWQAVRVYDADDLEQWLEQCPAVALQFAEELGIRGSEVESIARYWETWSQQAKPALTIDAFHTSREQSRDRLLTDLRKNIQSEYAELCSIQADSVEEAVAFVCSVLLAEPDLAAASLVVNDVAGWHFVEKHPTLKVAIATRPEIAQRPPQRTGLIVIIPYAIGDVMQSTQRDGDVNWSIERPDIYQFEKALATIGHSEGEAHRIAANTGRSWSIYRRRFAINPAIKTPAWFDKPQVTALSTLCLLGAWSGDNAVDNDTVSFLADCEHEEVEKALRHLSGLDDAPVLLIGKVWKAKSALELLHLFGSRISNDELNRFFDKTHEILSEPDPALELPDKDRYAAQIYGKVRPHSGLLINTLCDSLIKLAVEGAKIPTLADADIESKVARVVHDLLDNADGTRWLSLSSLLPALAEASPNEFIKAIEKSLAQADAPVTRLITETSGSGIMAGRCWHSGLLWALEGLAWSPKQFPRVALILARLAHVPFQGNWGNTPINSLVSLFRSWLPQTAATIDQRIAVLDILIDKEPEIAFNLLNCLVYVGSDTSMPTHRPKWRSDDAGFGRGVTHFEKHKMLTAAADKLITLSTQQPPRIIKLIEKLDIFDSGRIEKTLALIEPYTEPSAVDEDREILRAALRRKIHWHRNYGDKHENTQNIDVDALERLYHSLEPKDLLVRYRWLFANGWIDDISWQKVDYNQQSERTEALRLEAIQKIYAEQGMVGVQQFALSCKQSYWVGIAIAKLNIPHSQLVTWIIDNGDDFVFGEPLVEVIRGLLGALGMEHALELLIAVIDTGKQQNWSAEKIARCFMLAPQGMLVWNTVAAYSGEIEQAFWSSVQINFWSCDDVDGQRFVLERLLNVGRVRSALQLCQYSFDKVDAEMLIEMLERFLRGEEPEGTLLDSWNIGEALKRLQTSSVIDKKWLISLEFGLFPALGYGSEQQAETLYEGIMSEPALFTELLCILYKPRHSEQETTPTETEQSMASTAWDILHACHRQPCTQADGSIDGDAFIHFIDTTRQLCRDVDRLDVCDSTLGQILAYAPTDEDGIFPFKPAREILDRPELEAMRRGFQTGVFNKRGVTTRSHGEGGNQERKLADFYRQQGQALEYSHIHLAETLEELARYYESDGRNEDVSAKLSREMY